MSNRVIVSCDLCGCELDLKLSAPLDIAEYDRGWWGTDKQPDICPNHPRPELAAR